MAFTWPSEALIELAKPIKLLVLDVDGVLSDGQVYYGAQQEELKAFHTHDGLGLRMLQSVGVRVAIITGRASPMVNRRVQELGIDYVFQKVTDKRPVLDALCHSAEVSLSDVAYVGDDLPDLACIQAANLGIAVANANQFVQQQADAITTLPGGAGAVREVCEWILAAQGHLETLQQGYQ